MKLQYIGICREAECSSVRRAALDAMVDSAVGVPVACYILAKSEALSFAHAARKQTENWVLQKGHDGISLGWERISVICFLHIHTCYFMLDDCMCI